MTSPHPDHLWAAISLALTPSTCSSILAGRPVLARNLDGVALRHALRGAELPPADNYIIVTPRMLDAIREAAATDHAANHRKDAAA